MSSVQRFWVTALLCAALPALGQAQQTRRVTGTVTVQGSNEPVSGASVQVVGTTLGTLADDAGRFTVTVPAGPQQLSVRRLGYQAKVVPVGVNVTEVAVSLIRDVLQLETQVITGQATTVARANAANAVTVVNTEQLNRVPQQTVENALQGKVPGAIITQNSGAPGGGLQVQIRGTNTINGSYQPLYVIDGIVLNNSAFSNGLNAISAAGGGGTGQQGAAITGTQDQQVNRIADLNPENIESIEILKGPSAGAIYGSRGANGVVVITTKRGHAGKPTLDVIQRLGTQTMANKLDLRCFTEAEATQYMDENFASLGGAAGYFAQHPYAGCTDPQDQLYGNHGLSYETTASLRGGTGDGGTTYYASGTVKHDDALTKGDGYNKQSLRLNLSQLLGPKLSLRANSEVIHTLTQRGISGNDNAQISPYSVISSTPTFFDFSRRLPDGQYQSNPFVGSSANILQDQDAIKTPEDVYRILGSASADWAVMTREHQTLNVTLLGAVDHIADQSQVYSPPYTYVEQSGAISPYPGSVVVSNANAVNANLSLSLAHKYIARPFTATTSAGLRQERAQSTYITNQGQGLFPGVTNFATASQTSLAQGQDLAKTFSYFAQEEFLTLSERLLLTAAVNAERSSTNGDPEAFYAYPKFSASYRLPWLPPKTENVKLRLAYGKAGNRVPANYKYTYLQSLLEEGINGLRPSTTVGLPTVRPEQTTEIEGGLDATFLEGRAGLEVTQYHKKTTGLVLARGLAPSTGFTTQIINGGSLQNIGTEIGLNLIPVQAGTFSWTSNTTFSRNKGKILSLPVPAFNPGGSFAQAFGAYKIEVGYSPTQIVSFRGYDSTFVDGKYVSRTRHEVHIGDQAPDFQMGFTNSFTLGKVHLSTLVDWRKGGYVVNLSDLLLSGNLPGGVLADTAGSQARLMDYVHGNPAYVQHASFAKLREVTLSYDLSDAISRQLFRGTAQNARIELSGRNLYTWTNYIGLDPEVSNFGNAAIGRSQDVTPYPPSRQFFLSLSATF